jgi:hypothetical protein
VNTTERVGRAGAGTAMADAWLDDIADLRCTVTISRDHASDCGQRQVFLRLDGGTRVALVFGESFTTELEPGRHRLRVHNTLVWKTIDFAIEAGEHLEFIVINSARWWTAGMAGLLGAAPLFLKVAKRSIT